MLQPIAVPRSLPPAGQTEAVAADYEYTLAR